MTEQHGRSPRADLTATAMRKLAPVDTAETGGRDRRKTDAALKLWRTIPPELANKLIPMTPQLVMSAVQEIQRSVPDYAKPLQGKFREVLVGAVDMAVVKCFENICDPNTPQADWDAAFRYAGRVEFLEGRTLDALQTAVRVGARVVWRQLSAAGRSIGLPHDALFNLADAIFAWVDELCSAAIAGYTAAQARSSGALERRRRQLLKLLLADPPATRQSIVDLAGATDWDLPARVSVIALEYREDQHRLPASALGPEVLVDLESTEPCLVVADAARHLVGLQRELRGRRAAIGPSVPLADAVLSLRCARKAMSLVQRGVLPDQPITQCVENLSTLALMSDEFLVSHLTGRVLLPFANLTTKQRDRLESTLLAWLETRGGINEIATRLDVHPQTVRYRMHQLETLLGDHLSDPEERLTMEIALRYRRLIGVGTHATTDADEDEILENAI
ncbi:regulatory protein [Alloactinosynnema sp. L-07]|uniref:PucR family transcriptional regulator n=1 Tax=Alloactinosynnema sp. L-07 TaxID=1653480 RepID=UPI00065EF971|nr:PucR family transcriptional regulator [Alloactinosynnema sp. L-07]CRK57249.1 regulatory protein [Alloactinosynnema sp. L-07]